MHLVRLATTPLKDEEFTTGNHKNMLGADPGESL